MLPMNTLLFGEQGFFSTPAVTEPGLPEAAVSLHGEFAEILHVKVADSADVRLDDGVILPYTGNSLPPALPVTPETDGQASDLPAIADTGLLELSPVALITPPPEMTDGPEALAALPEHRLFTPGQLLPNPPTAPGAIEHATVSPAQMPVLTTTVPATVVPLVVSQQSGTRPLPQPPAPDPDPAISKPMPAVRDEFPLAVDGSRLRQTHPIYPAPQAEPRPSAAARAVDTSGKYTLSADLRTTRSLADAATKKVSNRTSQHASHTLIINESRGKEAQPPIRESATPAPSIVAQSATATLHVAGETVTSTDASLRPMAEVTPPVSRAPAMQVNTASQQSLPTHFAVDLPVQESGWDKAISERVLLMSTRRIQNAEIRLAPAELGPLRVTVTMDEGTASVAFQVQHALTRDAIELALPRLREMFAEQGLSLGQADVSDEGVSGENRDESGRARGGNSETADDIDIEERSPAVSLARAKDGLLDTFV